MKFEFNGQEFDTDKPTCVLGFVIQKDFGVYRKNDGFKNGCIRKYGPKAKKFYVKSLHFRLVEGSNILKSMELITSKRDDWTNIDGDNIIGHSTQECMKIYEAIKTRDGRVDE